MNHRTSTSFLQAEMNERRSARYFLCFRPADADGGEGRFVGKRSYDDRGISESARFGSVRVGDLRCPGKRLSVDGNVGCSRRCYSERVMESAPKDGEVAASTHLSGYGTGGDHSVGQASEEVLPAVESGRRRRTRKAFARVVSAIAFTTAAARNRNGKSSTESNQALSSSSRSSGKDRHRSGSFSTRSAPTLTCPVKHDENSRRPQKHDAQKVDSSSASFSSSSTSPSISAADSLQSCFEKGSTSCKYHNPCTSTTTALCLLAFTLTIMILWGRLCAILWTSTWLFCVRRRQSESPQKIPYSPPESTEMLAEVETKGYKKRIIMEGLLGRNHCRT